MKLIVWMIQEIFKWISTHWTFPRYQSTCVFPTLLLIFCGENVCLSRRTIFVSDVCGFLSCWGTWFQLCLFFEWCTQLVWVCRASLWSRTCPSRSSHMWDVKRPTLFLHETWSFQRLTHEDVGTKLASDHGHHNVIAAAFACGSCWHVHFQLLEIGMSVSSVESEYVVGFTSRVKLESQELWRRSFFRQFFFLRRAVSCAICSCVVFPSCECVSRCLLVLHLAQHVSGRWSHVCQRVQAICENVGCQTTSAEFLRTTHEEIPPLECEDAPGWLSWIQSRDDEAITEFCCATHVHDLARSSWTGCLVLSVLDDQINKLEFLVWAPHWSGLSSRHDCILVCSLDPREFCRKAKRPALMCIVVQILAVDREGVCHQVGFRPGCVRHVPYRWKCVHLLSKSFCFRRM